jgi:threonine dehydratase
MHLSDNGNMSDLVTLAEIRTAAARIAHVAVKTPLVEAAFLGLSGHGTGNRIWI